MIKIFKEVMLKELISRKERLQEEIDILETKKKSLMSFDKRENTKLRSRIKKLEFEIENQPKQKDRLIAVQRQQLKQLKSDEEITPQTEKEKEIVMPDVVNVDMMVYNDIPEGTEIQHLKFTNKHNETPKYHLIKENKELFKDE